MKNTAIAFELVQEFLDEGDVSYAELLEALKIIKNDDAPAYENFIATFDEETLANIATLMPEHMLSDILRLKSEKEIANALSELESDDATDLIQAIEEISTSSANKIFSHLDKDDQDEILFLKRYEDDHAGAYMQTEVFSAKITDTLQSAVNAYRKLKKDDEVENIIQLFITDEKEKLIFAINVADLILYDFSLRFSDLLKMRPELAELHTVRDFDDISEMISLVQDYDLSVVAVVNEQGRLLGRITHDDIHDLLTEQATEQIYNFAGVGDIDSEDENAITAAKSRAKWLVVNMITSLISAQVIAQFSDAIEKLVALAALMPIVASMGGNTGSQALAVTIRKLALGEMAWSNARALVLREVGISLCNATIFAILLGGVAFLWFKMPLLSLVIFISMVLNLGIAGLIGSIIPLILKRLGFDPALGSSVLLTASTDALGFFSFLLLAKLILI